MRAETARIPCRAPSSSAWLRLSLWCNPDRSACRATPVLSVLINCSFRATVSAITCRSPRSSAARSVSSKASSCAMIRVTVSLLIGFASQACLEAIGEPDTAPDDHLSGERLSVERGELRFADTAAHGIFLFTNAGGLEHFGQKACLESFGGDADIGLGRNGTWSFRVCRYG